MPTLIDDFTGTNGQLLSARPAGWTVFKFAPATNPPVINANNARFTGTDGSYAGASIDLGTADQDVEITLVAAPGAAFQANGAIYLRLSYTLNGGALAAASVNAIGLTAFGTNQVMLYNIENGEYKNPVSNTLPTGTSWAAGDKLRAKITGTTVTIYRNGTLIATVANRTLNQTQTKFGLGYSGTSTVDWDVADVTKRGSQSSAGGELVINGPSIIRMDATGATSLEKALGQNIAGGTAPYTISAVINPQSPMTIEERDGIVTVLSGTVSLTLAQFQNLWVKRTASNVLGSDTELQSYPTWAQGTETALFSTTVSALGDVIDGSYDASRYLWSPAAVNNGPVASFAAPVNLSKLLVIPGSNFTGIFEVSTTAGTAEDYVVVANNVALTQPVTNVITEVPLSGATNVRRLRVKSTVVAGGAAGFYSIRFMQPGVFSSVPDACANPLVITVTVTDSAVPANVVTKTLAIGDVTTPITLIETPKVGQPAFIELQENALGSWQSRGTLELTNRSSDIVLSNGAKFSGTDGRVWNADPSKPLPLLDGFQAWGKRFECGAGANVRHEYAMGFKPQATAWANYPFGPAAGKKTVPDKIFRWVVKDISGTVLKIETWNKGIGINDPVIAPKQFWPTDGNGNPNGANLRAYHIGQAGGGWLSPPPLRATAASLVAKVEPALPFTWRSVGVSNPIDYSIGPSERLGRCNIYAMEQFGRSGGPVDFNTQDPEMLLAGDRITAALGTGWGYQFGQTSARDVTTAPGGARVTDRHALGEQFQHVLQDPARVQPHRGTPWLTIAQNVLLSYLSENCFHIQNAYNPKPLALNKIGRGPRFANGYYQTQVTAGADQIDLVSGREASVNGGNDIPPRTGQYALAKTDPSGWLFWTGQLSDSEHNYPFAAIGALLFESPMMWWAAQHHFLQSSMVQDDSGYLTNKTEKGWWCLRTHAWPWANAAYMWAIAADHPDAVMTRATLEAQIEAELVKISDVEIPFISADPANLNSISDLQRAMIKRFGGFGSSFSPAQAASVAMLAIGYLFQGLTIWKKTGLWDAMRARNPKCGIALDYVLSRIAVCNIDLLLDAEHVMTVQGDFSYSLGAASNFPRPWPVAIPSGTSPNDASLPQSWAAWAAANGAAGATFWQRADGRYCDSPGQYMVLHTVTGLKRVFNYNYPRIDAAETKARALWANRKAIAEARGARDKGTVHFWCLGLNDYPVLATETGAVGTFA